MILPEIPESIPRGAVMAILRELGLDPKSLLSLELKHKGLYAETFAKDEAGKKIIEGDRLVTNKVFIRFD